MVYSVSLYNKNVRLNLGWYACILLYLVRARALARACEKREETQGEIWLFSSHKWLLADYLKPVGTLCRMTVCQK